MTAPTYTVSLDGGVLRRGFWIYAWEVVPPDGERLIYVGRTGDSSSANAQSPFNRMSQHLGFLKNSSMLRNHLTARGIDLLECTFRFVAHGPIFDEADMMDDHMVVRDVVAAVEKQLATDLAAAGYVVINEVRCRTPLDADTYASVVAAFAVEFPALRADRPR